MSEILNGPSISKHDKPEKLIFMLHGYGDNAANFLHLANPIDQDEWKVQYVAMNAPNYITGNLMGYQWFDLYPNGIYISEAGPDEFEQIRNEISVAVNKIINTMEKYCESLQLSLADCILMGFSQGGMMTLTTGPSLDLAGLISFSGALLTEQNLKQASHSSPPILLIHGDLDDVVPATALIEAQSHFEEKGYDVEVVLEKGVGHSIDQVGLDAARKFIDTHLPLE